MELPTHAATARERAVESISRLGAQELAVLQLVAVGVTDKETARVLHIALGTVRAYRRSIEAKTGAKGGVAMCRIACQAGVSSVWTDPREIAAKMRPVPTHIGARRHR